MATYRGRFDRDIKFTGNPGQLSAECILITAADESIFCLVTESSLLAQLMQADPRYTYEIRGEYNDASEDERSFVVATITRISIEK